MAVGGDPPSVASAATGDGTSGGSASASSRSGSGSASSRSGGRRSKSGSPQKSSSSVASKRSTTTGSTEADVAAMRHLRSIVAAIATDENLPPVDRSKKMADFEQLLEKAEKRLHFNESKLNGDPLGLLNPPEVVPKTTKGSSKKKRGWLKARLRGMRQRQNLAPTVASTPAVAKDQNMRFGGALETLEEERGDAEEERGNDMNPAGGSKHVSVPNDRVKPEAEARKEEVPAATKEEAEEKEVVDEQVEEVDDIEDDDTAGTATDSIIQMRMMNSEEYTASVCSIRSLSTFEKDFVNNVIAEQQVEEDRSVSTFEQDFMAREARGGHIALPTQVFMTGGHLNENEDDLTADATVLSETTFEQDAREQDARNASPPKGMLPMQITTSSNRTGANEGETDDDDITLDLDDVQSETTFEADQRQRAQARKEQAVAQAGSDPTTTAIFDQFASTVREVRSDETYGSVSTYMKDAQALKVLAAKIGRTPSTKSKARSVAEDILKNGTETSTNTFEEDYIAREMMMGAVARGGGGIGMAPPPASNVFVPRGPVMARFPSENSTGTFEKDMNVRRPQRPQLGHAVEASGRAADGRPLAPLAVVAGMPHPGGGVPDAALSPLSTATMAQHQMQPTPQQYMSPPQQVGLRSTPEPSPMPVSTLYGPSYAGALPIGSPPSQTAFENDTVRGSIKTGAASSHSGRGLGSTSVGTTSLGGFERDARAGMKNVGTVYPMNHVPNGGAGRGGGPASSVASAYGYDGGALMAHGGGGPGAASAIDLSVAAQRELTAQVDAKRAAAALPKISPLVMELSPDAIDKGVKLREREGTMWSKFMCWTGS